MNARIEFAERMYCLVYAWNDRKGPHLPNEEPDWVSRTLAVRALAVRDKEAEPACADLWAAARVPVLQRLLVQLAIGALSVRELRTYVQEQGFSADKPELDEYLRHQSQPFAESLGPTWLGPRLVTSLPAELNKFWASHPVQDGVDERVVHAWHVTGSFSYVLKLSSGRALHVLNQTPGTPGYLTSSGDVSSLVSQLDTKSALKRFRQGPEVIELSGCNLWDTTPLDLR